MCGSNPTGDYRGDAHRPIAPPRAPKQTVRRAGTANERSFMSEVDPWSEDCGHFSWRETSLMLALVLFVTLRAYWIGHLLTWDEAATLLSVRSFAARGVDYYAGWFWRRPPFYNLLLTLVQPLSPGLHTRAQMLSLCIALLSAFVLWVLNRSVFGKSVALWSVCFLAVMPGAVFYDTWIKQDGMAALFGLLAVLLFARGRPLQSGLCLGAGFLTKELTVFYAVSILIIWWGARRQRSWKDLAATYATAGAMAGWWYVLFSNSVKAVLRFLTDSTNMETQVWTRPWYYFFEQLSLDLEGWGILLALYGCVALWLLKRKMAEDQAHGAVASAQPALVWPLAILVPAYALMTFMKAKTPWYTISLFPAWATLQAVGMNGIMVRARAFWGGSSAMRSVLRMAAAFTIVGAVGLRWKRDYEAELRQREWGLWWGSATSRATAQRLNELVKDEERVLITPMFYWAVSKHLPCVLFVYYLKPGIPVVVRPYDLTLEEFVNTVREFKLHWAMISPDPRVGEKQLIHPLIIQYGLKPYWNSGAVIFRTDSLWREGEKQPSG
jgi:4-amino-4-deoxy-L-arabinose transferase-like glycosyltransferase